MIHKADPRTVVITIFTRDVRTYIRPSSFQNLAKQNEFQVRLVITTRGTVGLAEGIIYDPHTSSYTTLFLIK